MVQILGDFFEFFPGIVFTLRCLYLFQFFSVFLKLSFQRFAFVHNTINICFACKKIVVIPTTVVTSETFLYNMRLVMEKPILISLFATSLTFLHLSRAKCPRYTRCMDRQESNMCVLFPRTVQPRQHRCISVAATFSFCALSCASFNASESAANKDS